MTRIDPGRAVQTPVRILCVDDNEFGLYVNTIILRSEGYQVTACSDVAKAIEIAKAQALDLGVFDYQMPVMNGAELAAACKAANPEMKAILFSGDCDIPKQELAVADLFVSKSDGIQALLEGIAALLLRDKKPASFAPPHLAPVNA
jgi:CheY-like chemotaxis protein